MGFDRPARHLKLIEAVGVALVLLAWILNWWSVDKWNRADRTLEHAQESMTAMVGAIQTTANIRLEAAVSHEVGRHPADPSSDRARVYAQAWRSAEVRERWLTVQINSL